MKSKVLNRKCFYGFDWFYCERILDDDIKRRNNLIIKWTVL